MEPAPVAAFEEVILDGHVRENPSTGEISREFPVARIKLWVAHDIRCAIYWGSMSFNGYCQLPVDHPDRVIAEAYNDFEHNRDDEKKRWWLQPESNIGYDILGDLQVHGGLTYGPDEEGWLGFDTGHAGDDWSDDEIYRWLYPASQDAWRRFQQMQLLLKGMWPPGRVTREGRALPWDRDWTMEMLEAEVDRLAAQLDQRRGQFVMNGTH